MKKNLFIGILMSALFIYLALRGINVEQLAESFASARYIYIFPVIGLVVLAHYLRSYRWGIIMQSLVTYDQRTLFVLSSIGFMAIGILPARLGEFARPYLVKQKSGVRMTATMATIVVERIFDVLALMLVLFAVLLKIPLPSAIFKPVITLLSVAFSAFLVLIFLAVKKEFSLNAIDRVLRALPARFAGPLKRVAHSFIEGLQMLPDIGKTIYVAALSVVVWIVLSLSAYVLFFAFNFDLGIINAFALSVIIAVGVMLPAAPGFVGTYHLACKLGLTQFAIPETEALAYAILLHFLQMIPVVGLGLIFLPFQKLSLPAFIQKEEAELEKERLAE